MEKDCTELVERLKSFESRYCVALGAIFAGWNPEDNLIIVRGELRSSNGKPGLAETLSVKAVAYDDRGRVVASDDRIISSDDFFEFDVFELNLSVANRPAKISVFPKKF
jgi:hypothetical protein